MMEFLNNHHLLGLVIGVCTFLCIGLFHPLVIKGEYYFGVKVRWVFLFAGFAFAGAALIVENILLQAVMGVTSCSCFWSILEIFEQQERVRKGWFPRNPRRTYYWDKDKENE